MQAAEIDLDLQTRPSEGPNTSSMWIWRTSVQWFPRYFIHKQKSHRPKTELYGRLTDLPCKSVSRASRDCNKPSISSNCWENTSPVVLHQQNSQHM